MRRGGRAAEGNGLLNRRRVTPTAGSNPALSAIYSHGQHHTDPRSKTAGCSEEQLNPQIPLTPFFQRGNRNGDPVTSYGE